MRVFDLDFVVLFIDSVDSLLGNDGLIGDGQRRGGFNGLQITVCQSKREAIQVFAICQLIICMVLQPFRGNDRYRTRNKFQTGQGIRYFEMGFFIKKASFSWYIRNNYLSLPKNLRL